MKKFVFSIFAACALLFASCTSNNRAGASVDTTEADSIEVVDSVAVDSVDTDTLLVDTIVEEVAE